MSFFDKKSSLPYFIAEISSNHNQDLNRAKELIDISAEAGFDAVKFQLFTVNELFSSEAISKYPSILDRKQWELPINFIPELKEYAAKRNLHFGCTPFYLSVISEVKDYVDFFKIASYEILWLKLIESCVATNKPLVFSTGMANISEIKAVFDLTKKYPKSDVSVLHCCSAYPTPIEEANISAIKTIRDNFNVKSGWSDHTSNIGVIFNAALKYKAEIFELHIDKEGKGYEFSSGHCWLPREARLVIEGIRDAFSSDGNGEKKPLKSEISDRNWRADAEDGLRPIKSFRKKL